MQCNEPQAVLEAVPHLWVTLGEKEPHESFQWFWKGALRPPCQRRSVKMWVVPFFIMMTFVEKSHLCGVVCYLSIWVTSESFFLAAVIVCEQRNILVGLFSWFSGGKHELFLTWKKSILATASHIMPPGRLFLALGAHGLNQLLVFEESSENHFLFIVLGMAYGVMRQSATWGFPRVWHYFWAGPD